MKMLRQKSKETMLKQKNRQLKMLKINFFNLIIIHNTEKTFETATVFIKTVEKCVNALKYCINNIFHYNNNKKNSDKNIIKII